jgi:hypothetical protein
MIFKNYSSNPSPSLTYVLKRVKLCIAEDNGYFSIGLIITIYSYK